MTEHAGENQDLPARPTVGSAALIIHEDRSRILLGRRAKDPNRGRWVMPGGKIERYESIDEAVIREVREETALDVDVVERLGIFEIIEPPEHVLFVLTEVRVIGGISSPGDDLDDLMWVFRSQLPDTDLSDPCRATLSAVGWIDEVSLSSRQEAEGGS